jgi:hypothetical protein
MADNEQEKRWEDWEQIIARLENVAKDLDAAREKLAALAREVA